MSVIQPPAGTESRRKASSAGSRKRSRSSGSFMDPPFQDCQTRATATGGSRVGPSLRELDDAPLSARLEVGPLLAPELGGGLVGEPPLAPDPQPVAGGVE